MLENGWLVYLCFDKLLLKIKFLVSVEYLGSENRSLAKFSSFQNWEMIVVTICFQFYYKKNIVNNQLDENYCESKQ